MNSKDKNRNCEHCLYGLKNYFSIGNKVFLSHVSACSRMEKPKDDTPFKTRDHCLFFVQDKIPSTTDETGQQLFHLYRQLDEITDLILDILNTLNQSEDDDSAQLQIKNSVADN